MFNRKLGIIVLLSLIPTLLIWLPFLLRLNSFWGIPLPTAGLATIIANYDGPLYLVIAKSLYLPSIIKTFSFVLPVQYYAAHFPLYPGLIRLVSFFITPVHAMLAVTLISSVIATYFFYKLISIYVDEKKALWITFIFTVFPARWLIVRSVGSAEPLFVGSIIASLYYFKNKKFLLAGLWGAIAQLTKSPAILLFMAYVCAVGFPMAKNKNFKDLKHYLPIILIPLALLAIFVFYGVRFGDFLAYFHSGDNIHLLFPPFQIFNYSLPWVGTFWLEEIIFVYLFGILGLLKLMQMKETVFAWFVAIFFATTLFVAHRDLIRYSLPIVPFLLIAYADVLAKKEFKIAMAVIIIPIYLFSLAYISQNVMPISNWQPFF